LTAQARSSAGSEPTIGIVAGMGPHSTGFFIDLVVQECELQYGAYNDIDYPRMFILSLPTPFFVDRPIDHIAMESALRNGVGDLARTGCDFIVIACNTAHLYHAQLARCVGVPLLDMVDLSVAAVPANAREVALLASRATAESAMYPERLSKRGLRALELNWQADVDRLIGSVRLPPAERAMQWQSLARRAVAGGADVVLLACADLTAISRDLVIDLPVVDATRRLAEATVTTWLKAAELAGRPRPQRGRPDPP